MFVFLIIAVSALCSVQATGLTQTIKDLHLHAKLGEGIPESVPLTDPLDPVDQHVSLVAQRMVMKKLHKYSFLIKKMYGPIENVVLPGINLPRPINLSNIRMTGQSRLKLNDLQWRMASNRVMCNATIPHLLVDVTFANVQIGLDENFGHEQFLTNIGLSVHLLDLEFIASARYNMKDMLNDTVLFIDKAEVDINAREAVFELSVVQALEEVRYVLSELFNNPLEDIADAVLKVVVNEINKELHRVNPKNITVYWKNSTAPKEVIPLHGI